MNTSFLLLTSYQNHTMAYTTEIHTVPLYREIYSQPAPVAVQFSYLCLCLWCSTPAVSGSIRRFVLPSLAQISDKIHMQKEETASLPPGHQAIQTSHGIARSFSSLCCTSHLKMSKIKNKKNKNIKKGRYRKQFISLSIQSGIQNKGADGCQLVSTL